MHDVSDWFSVTCKKLSKKVAEKLDKRLPIPVCLPCNHSQTINTHTMNQPTRDNIDVAILSGRMTSVEAFEAVKHPDSKAYILKYHMDEELEMYLAKAH